nr:olfactory receptor 37 [Gregopimpla kuwanae]
MKTLEYSFTALQWCGLWRPAHWPPGWKSKLYDIYTWFALFILVSFTLAQFVEVVHSINDVGELANNSFLMLTLCADCGKAVNVLMKRSEIIELTESLQHDPCLPKNKKELAVQHQFDNMARFNVLRFAAASGFTVVVLVVKSLVEDLPQRSLPFNVWLPFESSESLLGYWIAYSHQMLGICISCGIGVAFDTFVPALMLQICAQLNILKHRFIEMPRSLLDMTNNFKGEEHSHSCTLKAESKLLSLHVQHHLKIFKFAENVNDLFGLMIFLQYTLSTLIICACLLNASQMKILSSLFAVLFIYIAEMSLQVLMYCFYGGEVTIESINLCDGIYEMDWTALSVDSKRSLLMIMARTTRPITFTSAHILTMNLESFKSLLKLSYSTFNVLQTRT